MSSQQTRRVKRSNGVGHGHAKAPQMVPLASLLSYELKNEVLENPILRAGLAIQPRKGEDFALVNTECEIIPGDASSTIGVFGVFDGHNGAAAAIYSKENLLNDVLSAIPRGLRRDEWLAALPRALVAGFVKTDKDFQMKEQTSGTTVTFVVIDGWTVTVASVGDSRCVLDSQGTVTALTVDHRLDTNQEERERIKASGGEVGRLSIVGGAEIGPLRCWPGGLCLSRSIGDMDVGEYIVPIPYVKQIKLSNAGGRLIIASDGVWDALSSEKAAKCCRGLQQADVAAKHIVKVGIEVSKALAAMWEQCLHFLLGKAFIGLIAQETLRTRGLRDDTTCLVVDLVPPSSSRPPPAVIKNQSRILRFFRWRGVTTAKDRRSAEVSVMQELFEEGSAMLAERLGGGESSSVHGGNGLFVCAICQRDIEASESISVHAGAFFSASSRPWEGPFLCVSCKWKKDAMEGKRTARGVGGWEG